jgi:hypothetical protein
LNHEETMAIKQFIQTGYGLSQAIQNLTPEPVKAKRAPKTSDTGYEIGQIWVNVPANAAYVLTSITANSANWQLLQAAAGTVDFLAGNSGGNVGPTAGGVINTIGGNNITVTGNPGTNTLTASVTGTTNHALQLGNSTGSLTSLGAATNGQLPIGSTGLDPVLATLTAGGGITITNGAGSITVTATGTPSSLTVTPVNTSPYVVLGTDQFIAVDSSGGAITIQLPNAPVTGRVFYIKDSTGSAAVNNITVTTVGGAVNIDGATSFVMNTTYQSTGVIFDGTAYEIF